MTINLKWLILTIYDHPVLSVLFNPPIHMAFVIGLMFLGKKYLSFSNWKPIVIISLLYLTNSILSSLPLFFTEIHSLIDSQWNWEGKFFSLLFLGIVFSFSKYKEFFYPIFPSKFQIKYLAAILIFYLVTSGWTIFHIEFSKFNWDSFGFQMTMPSLTEEILFRSMIFGLMINRTFRNQTNFWISAIIVSILFGFAHNSSFEINQILEFSFGTFIETFVYSVFWCWLTYKSNSIIYSMVSHSLNNFSFTFIWL